MERYKLEIVNDHGDRYIRCEPATDGSWVMFKDVAELQNKGCARDQTTTQYCAEVIERDKRIAELEEALATARRDAMEEAAQIADREPELVEAMPAEFEKFSRETLARAACIVTKRAIAAAIGAAALAGGKDG